MDDDDHTADLEFLKTLFEQARPYDANKARSHKAECRTYRLSDLLAVEITIQRGRMNVLWDPTIPDTLTDHEAECYRKATDEMVGVLAAVTAIRAVAACPNARLNKFTAVSRYASEAKMPSWPAPR